MGKAEAETLNITSDLRFTNNFQKRCQKINDNYISIVIADGIAALERAYLDLWEDHPELDDINGGYLSSSLADYVFNKNLLNYGGAEKLQAVGCSIAKLDPSWLTDHETNTKAAKIAMIPLIHFFKESFQNDFKTSPAKTSDLIAAAEKNIKQQIEKINSQINPEKIEDNDLLTFAYSNVEEPVPFPAIVFHSWTDFDSDDPALKTVEKIYQLFDQLHLCQIAEREINKPPRPGQQKFPEEQIRARIIDDIQTHWGEECGKETVANQIFFSAFVDALEQLNS
jgi:hypothetical protein